MQGVLAGFRLVNMHMPLPQLAHIPALISAVNAVMYQGGIPASICHFITSFFMEQFCQAAEATGKPSYTPQQEQAEASGQPLGRAQHTSGGMPDLTAPAATLSQPLGSTHSNVRCLLLAVPQQAPSRAVHWRRWSQICRLHCHCSVQSARHCVICGVCALTTRNVAARLHPRLHCPRTCALGIARKSKCFWCT